MTHSSRGRCSASQRCAYATASATGNRRTSAAPTLPRTTGRSRSKSEPSSSKRSESIVTSVTTSQRSSPAGCAPGAPPRRAGTVCGIRRGGSWCTCRSPRRAGAPGRRGPPGGPAGCARPAGSRGRAPRRSLPRGAPRAAKEVCGWALRRAPGQVRTVSGITPTPRLGVTRGSYAGIVARSPPLLGYGRIAPQRRVGEVPGLGGDHQRAVGAECVEQSLDDGDRAAVDPAEGAQGGVREQRFSRLRRPAQKSARRGCSG